MFLFLFDRRILSEKSIFIVRRNVDHSKDRLWYSIRFEQAKNAITKVVDVVIRMPVDRCN